MNDNDIITETKKSTTQPFSNGFIPKLRGKKVTIRLISGGQPITLSAFGSMSFLT